MLLLQVNFLSILQIYEHTKAEWYSTHTHNTTIGYRSLQLLMKRVHMYSSTCACWVILQAYMYKHIIFSAASNRISYLITRQIALIRELAVLTLHEQEVERGIC